MSKYTLVEQSRILRDGKPFVYIEASTFDSEGTRLPSIVAGEEVTAFAREIVAALNPKPDQSADAREQAKLQYDDICDLLHRREAAREDWTIFEQRGEVFVSRDALGDDEKPLLLTRAQVVAEFGSSWVAVDKGEELTEDSAERAIHEKPLSVEVRSGWFDPCARDADKAPAEFQILLCTGGPAVRLIGELDSHGEPSKARLEFQGWFTGWTEWNGEGCGDDRETIDSTLLEFASAFYFGEG